MKQNYQPDWNINWSIYQNIELVVKPTAVVHSSVMSIILQPSATDKLSAIHIVINKKNIQLMSQSYKLDFWSNIQEGFSWACWSLGISPRNNWWFDVCIFNRCGNHCFMFPLVAFNIPAMQCHSHVKHLYVRSKELLYWMSAYTVTTQRNLSPYGPYWSN